MMSPRQSKQETPARDMTSFRHGRGCDRRSADHMGFARGIRLLVRGIFPEWLSLFWERRPQPRPVMLLAVPLSVPHGDREEY